MDESGAETLVEWREWGADAFAEASRRQCPLLLSLSTPWCVECREMDETTYAEPRVAARIDEGFVPVRVDADRQPRVRERYVMGGFPSTVFLTPEGTVLTGAGYLSPEGLRQVLDSVRETWAAKGRESGRVPRSLRDPDPPAGDVDAGIESHMVEQVAAAFDEEFGGWGQGAKFPLPTTVEFAAKRDRDRATRTLEAVRTHLVDTYGGGFYRFAEERDWSSAHREKLLDENAALVRAFATGYLYTGEGSYRETAEDAVDYLTTTLWAGEAGRASEEARGQRPRAGGAFAASQAGGDYYTLSASARERADPPRVDRTVFADRNGLAADALLRFSAYTDHEGARRYAERALDHVAEHLVDDGLVRHFAGEDSETGLLVDQARVLRGLTTAAQVTGRDLDAATAVADAALETGRDGEGAFLDGPREGPGLLDRPLRPLEWNVELADALLDLSYLADDAGYRATAGEALAAFAGAADRMGVEVAGYATACARYHYDPLVIETPPAGTDLHRAAWRVADHEKVVVPGEREAAVVVRSGERSAPATTPAELSERVAEADTVPPR